MRIVGEKERRDVLKKEVDRIVRVLRRNVHLEKVVLFGSLVSGRLSPQSDIDLLIVQESSDSIFERVKKIETLLQRKVAADLIVLTPPEVQMLLKADNRYLKNILSHGKVLYERAA